ncbi:MAG: nicotinamide mononucleotide transporter [Proteobacteria bacterium]|nr:nicotinamide mononucleotide transporter [Pseudomonadota bacterium]
MTPAELAGELGRALAGVSATEAAGAILGFVYVLLAIRQHRAAWLASFASTALYLVIFARAGLGMQAGLQVFFLAAAVYGWFAWRGGGGGDALPVTRVGARSQLAGAAVVLLATALSLRASAAGAITARETLDALTTWASVYATWLATRKHLESWAWWVVIDVLIAVLCWRERLYPSMMLYALFVGLALWGWRSWYRDMNRPPSPPASAA